MVEWLSDEQQASWRHWIAAATLVPDRLNRDIQATNGLTLTDYEILVRLSESPDRKIRMSLLAKQTLMSRSRLSHQIDRMSSAKLVERASCPQDGRGLYARLTDSGYERLKNAAPDHVASVRNVLVSALTEEEFRTLGKLSAKILQNLEDRYGENTTRPNVEIAC
jgi:DNA-binding MarR family transcriptional regulator